jgi:hypothetical protein
VHGEKAGGVGHGRDGKVEERGGDRGLVALEERLGFAEGPGGALFVLAGFVERVWLGWRINGQWSGFVAAEQASGRQRPRMG